MGASDLESQLLLQVLIYGSVEVLLQKAGNETKRHIRVLDGDRPVVDQACAANVVNELIGRDVERLGDFGCGVYDRKLVHIAGHCLAGVCVFCAQARHLPRSARAVLGTAA